MLFKSKMMGVARQILRRRRNDVWFKVRVGTESKSGNPIDVFGKSELLKVVGRAVDRGHLDLKGDKIEVVRVGDLEKYERENLARLKKKYEGRK